MKNIESYLAFSNCFSWSLNHLEEFDSIVLVSVSETLVKLDVFFIPIRRRNFSVALSLPRLEASHLLKEALKGLNLASFAATDLGKLSCKVKLEKN